MAKVFVSYKHRDGLVTQISGRILPEYGITTARNYVDMLDPLLSQAGHVCKAEESGEDLAGLSEETITAKLADRIYDSTVTVVLLSKGMSESGKSQREQWIPWEISYSLKEKTREDRTSYTNAMLAVALPDENGSYSYIVNHYPCVITWNTASLFKILGDNMFNRNQKNLIRCGTCNGSHHTGQDHSYIHPVKWSDFIVNINGYLDHVVSLNKNLDDYDIVKEI